VREGPHPVLLELRLSDQVEGRLDVDLACLPVVVVSGDKRQVSVRRYGSDRIELAAKLRGPSEEIDRRGVVAEPSGGS